MGGKQVVKAKKYAGLMGNQNARALDPRVKKVTVRFTEEEFERVATTAKMKGESVAEFMRGAALGCES